MLQYTGHPLFDVGVAATTAFVEKSDPATLTEADLEKVADYIRDNYTVPPLTSFLTVSLMNSDFTQPAYKDNIGRKQAYADRVTRSFGLNVPVSDEICVFTGLPALGLPLSLKAGKDQLPPGRAYRQHVPLITGEGIINFSPGGDPGLPVSGVALLCLQFFPMGCQKCGGRLLAVHSDNPEIILYFARQALHENLRAISQAQLQEDSKMPEALHSAQTLLIKTILDVESQRRDARQDSQPYSVTAYHLSNSGQSSPLDHRSPPLQIYHLPLEIIDFLGSLVGADYRNIWNKLAQRGWEVPRTSQKPGSPEGQNQQSKPRRNYLYEDLFRLPEQTRPFVRTYLLRLPERSSSQEHPRRDYHFRDEIALISWQLTELLLRKVIRMDKQRIDEIRDLGDRLATYVKEQDDKRFFYDFFRVQRADYFRTLLLRANLRHIKAGNDPLITLDPYLTVFEEGDEVMRPDWRFARDLVLIRMVESLYTNGWIGKHPDLLPDDTDIGVDISEGKQ
jgi:CRISPR-associated protein Cst1